MAFIQSGKAVTRGLVLLHGYKCEVVHSPINVEYDITIYIELKQL